MQDDNILEEIYIRLCSLIVHESRHLHSYNDDTNKVYNKLILIICHPLVVIVNTVRCLCLSNYMRACVFRRPRKSLTSPDAEKTSAATQRPGEELPNWQVPYSTLRNLWQLNSPMLTLVQAQRKENGNEMKKRATRTNNTDPIMYFNRSGRC